MQSTRANGDRNSKDANVTYSESEEPEAESREVEQLRVLLLSVQVQIQPATGNRPGNASRAIVRPASGVGLPFCRNTTVSVDLKQAKQIANNTAKPASKHAVEASSSNEGDSRFHAAEAREQGDRVLLLQHVLQTCQTLR